MTANAYPIRGAFIINTFIITTLIKIFLLINKIYTILHIKTLSIVLILPIIYFIVIYFIWFHKEQITTKIARFLRLISIIITIFSVLKTLTFVKKIKIFNLDNKSIIDKSFLGFIILYPISIKLLKLYQSIKLNKKSRKVQCMIVVDIFIILELFTKLYYTYSINNIISVVFFSLTVYIHISGKQLIKDIICLIKIITWYYRGFLFSQLMKQVYNTSKAIFTISFWTTQSIDVELQNNLENVSKEIDSIEIEFNNTLNIYKWQNIVIIYLPLLLILTVSLKLIISDIIINELNINTLWFLPIFIQLFVIFYESISKFNKIFPIIKSKIRFLGEVIGLPRKQLKEKIKKVAWYTAIGGTVFMGLYIINGMISEKKKIKKI